MNNQRAITCQQLEEILEQEVMLAATVAEEERP
jgi:hypothetical protein